LHAHVWILDGGATEHMTPIQNMLYDYKPDLHPTARVKVANDQYAYRAGVGTLLVRITIDGIESTRSIQNVWHVPDLAHSLLSLRRLKEKGYWHFGGKNGDPTEYLLDKNDKIVLACPERNGLLLPDWDVVLHPDVKHAPSLLSYSDEPEPAQACYAHPNHSASAESPLLWHMRLGHANCHSLQKLVQHGLVTGINVPHTHFNSLKNHVCDVCVMAKHAAAPFKPRQHRASSVMEVLHSDVHFYEEESLGGASCAVTLLDEYSNKCGVAVLQNKAQVSQSIKDMVTAWETRTGTPCKRIYTDRGGEYISGDLQRWLASKGIVHEMSVPRTPQENGKAERLNRTLAERVRSMLFQYNLPKSLWAHALVYAATLHNVGLNTRLGSTPHQAFLGTVPSVKNFRTFGCKVLAKVPDTQRSKLDPKSEPGIYLGPDPKGAGCKVLVWRPHYKSKVKYAVLTVRDVVTFETPDVLGAAQATDLHWGGDIPLPSARPLPHYHQPQEGLSDTPHARVETTIGGKRAAEQLPVPDPKRAAAHEGRLGGSGGVPQSGEPPTLGISSADAHLPGMDSSDQQQRPLWPPADTQEQLMLLPAPEWLEPMRPKEIAPTPESVKGGRAADLQKAVSSIARQQQTAPPAVAVTGQPGRAQPLLATPSAKVHKVRVHYAPAAPAAPAKQSRTESRGVCAPIPMRKLSGISVKPKVTRPTLRLHDVSADIAVAMLTDVERFPGKTPEMSTPTDGEIKWATAYPCHCAIACAARQDCHPE
jgi:GAG-pre-integrase domain/Integrase core domain